MKTTAQLYELGRSLWLDNITSELLDCGKLERNCTEFSLTGLMSIPTIFDQAIRNTAANYNAIHRKVKEGESGEALFFEFALAAQFQREGVQSFSKYWGDLMAVIASQSN